MANYKTGAQRHNDRMDKIWDTAKKNGSLSDENLKEARAHENTSRDKKKAIAKKMFQPNFDAVKKVVKKEYRGEHYKKINEAMDKSK